MIKIDSVEPVGNSDKLKPCPFCGGEAGFLVKRLSEEKFERGWVFGISCAKCKASTPRTDYKLAVKFTTSGEISTAVDERPLAIEAWNRRSENG